jgi:hypothetical protein
LETQAKTIDLSQFYGTESYHRTNLFTPQLVHTDGVQYFADQGGCYWFLDIVASEYYPLLAKEPFLSIYLMVRNSKATITCQDGDLKVLRHRDIAHTDCPDGEYSFYLTDGVLMLTSEY